MKKFLLVFSLIISLICSEAFAQPATVGVPVAIGRDACGVSTGTVFAHTNSTGSAVYSSCAANDSVYFFGYSNATLTKSTTLFSYLPRLRIGNSTFIGRIAGVNRNYRDRFTVSAASVSYNPRDRRIYYIWTDYNLQVAPVLKSYIWSWPPDTTFATGAAVPYNTGAAPGTAAPAASLMDTVRSFAFDIGGVTFDNIGTTWQLEFSNPPAPYKSMMRRLNFTTGVIDPIADTMDLIPGAGGRGDTMYNVGSGDITLMPNGQMYYAFDNKLFTPDYGSYGGGTHHITSTYIDTIRRPTGTTALVGLAFSDGDLISSLSPSCNYRRMDPITGDTNFVNYTYPLNKGVRATDMTQITSGLGIAKKLVSIINTGTSGQYDVVYDVYVKNYGTTRIENIQVYDSLSKINGAGNVSNVSISMQTIPPPPGIALNPAYNGITDARLLQTTGQNLNNFPLDSSSFVLRINCRISNVLQGVVYYNSAIGFANGYKNVPLRDSSTNGDVPDLNQNDKPDDVGEGIPTPFLIALTPIPSPCATLTATLYTENFGAGVGLSSTLNGSYNTTYTGSVTQPIARNTYSLTNNARLADTTNFISMTDHTGNANGRMMIFNADAPPRYFFRDTMPTSCPGRQYSLSFWAAFPANSVYATACDALGGFRYPRVKMRMIDIVTGLTVTELTSDTFYSPGWTQRGMRWTMPAGYSNLIMELSNAAPGGCGNDIVIDDIVYGTCDAFPTVSANALAGCLGDSVRFVGALSDSLVFPGAKDHQWQVAPSAGGPWTDIVGATGPTFTINPILPADTGKFYRIIVAAQGGSINIPICRSTSPGIQLTGRVPSAAPTTAGKNKNGSICPGIPVKIYRTGGITGTGATWRWYTGSPGGTLIGTGDTLTVTPTVNTKYYIRAEGTCNTTTADSVVINISCDIDKDDDGIPDFIESNIPAAIANGYNTGFAGYKDNNNDFINDDFQADGDSDNDGIVNYLDLDFAGRVDSDSDGIDDRFDADLDGIINMLDLDSDNDGVPDVAEANGVDADGNGRIDNFTDTDGDGLSQNVDANNTGANNSSIGLGLLNFDNDTTPNFIDLDSDNDGIPDVVEVAGADTNNDGIIDGFVDANTDGLHDSYINATGLLLTGADITSDGRADSYPNKNFDGDARPNAYDIDSDGDGILDVAEAGFNNPSLIGWVVGPFGADGWSDVIDAMATLTLQNTDGRGNPNHLDIDSDDDGIPDQIEGQPTANPLPSPYNMPLGTDADRDGLDTRYDNVPAAFGGRGIIPLDLDGDGTPDYMDLDTDADGQLDIYEGNDFNLNGIADDDVTLTLLDTDGDGLDNKFDSSNTTMKGTSYNLANGGYTAGDPAPGAKCPVQRRLPANTDRDWRFSGSVLPVQILQFTGVQQSNTVNLNWLIITPQQIDRFEIERSTNNSTYNKIGQLSSAVQLNVQQSFTYPDDIANVSGDVVYYRLKVITKSGEVKYSNVLVVRKTTTKATITVMPNPAKDYLQVRLYSDKTADVLLKLFDASGKIVLQQNQKVQKGNNTLQLNGLTKFSRGNYMLQINSNNELTTHKVLLTQ